MRSLCKLDMQGWFIICKSRNVPNNINAIKDRKIAQSEIDPEEACDKIQHVLMGKSWRVGLE